MGINEYEEMVEANKSTAVEEGEEDLGEVKTIEVEEEMRGEFSSSMSCIDSVGCWTFSEEHAFFVVSMSMCFWLKSWSAILLDKYVVSMTTDLFVYFHC